MKTKGLGSWAAAVLFLGAVDMSSADERLTIERQVRLSPGHLVAPYSIKRASNGDLVIFGANDDMEYRPWATRIAATGESRWEFLEGTANGWQDTLSPGQSFSSAIEMPDQVTLLCGIKLINKQRYIVLSQIGLRGNLIDERTIQPDVQQKGSIITGIECIQWGDGILLIGGVSGLPRGTGWIAMLDKELKLQWQKFGDEYGGSKVMNGPGGSLLYMNSVVRTANGSNTTLMQVDSSLNLIASHVFSISDNPLLVYPTYPQMSLRVVFLKDNFVAEIADFDSHLRGPSRLIKMRNVGVKRCVGLSDGSIAIFGSQSHGGAASAAVTRVYKDGSYATFTVEPSIRSPWYFDGVATDSPGAFVAVRQNNGGAQVDWLTLK